MCAGRCGRSAPGTAGPAPAERGGCSEGMLGGDAPRGMLLRRGDDLRRDAAPGRDAPGGMLRRDAPLGPGSLASPKGAGRSAGQRQPFTPAWGSLPRAGGRTKGPAPLPPLCRPCQRGPLSAFPGRGGTGARRIVPAAQPCRGRTTDVRLRFAFSPKLFSLPVLARCAFPTRRWKGK